jgi:hypothetical protein
MNMLDLILISSLRPLAASRCPDVRSAFFAGMTRNEAKVFGVLANIIAQGSEPRAV